MKPYVSQPIMITAEVVGASFSRADLILEGVDHSTHSLSLRIFFNNPDANATTPKTADGYVGELFVLGHGGCFGAAGHCDTEATPRLPFDLRPPHQLLPAKIWMLVTEGLKTALKAGQLVVSVVPVFTHDPAPDEMLHLESVSIVTYA
jgi:tyrosinase